MSEMDIVDPYHSLSASCMPLVPPEADLLVQYYTKSLNISPHRPHHHPSHFSYKLLLNVENFWEFDEY
jgi:hypothetical protein